jgi:hypothetical protein
MKSFIVAALLVASVASFDLMDLTKDSRSLFKPNHHELSTVEKLLLKEKLGNQQMMGYKNLDMDRVFRGQQINILSLEELVSHPLLKEYMQFPLFVQLWEDHPVAFKRYVESPVFQQFWQVPEFQMYFRNVYYFNKYIVPQVQMISQSVYPSTEGIFNYERTTPKYTPFVYNKYQPMYNREYPTYGQNVYSGLNNKYLLEKMYNHLNMNNKVGQDVTETFTNIKMLPTGQVQEQTVGKIVDPITGEEKITVGDFKLVDNKIVPVDTLNFNKYQMDKIFGHHNIKDVETIKDVLLKNIIVNKIFGEKKTFSPEVYQTVFDKEMTPEIYSNIFHSKKISPEMENIFGTQKVLSPEVYESLFDNNKVMFSNKKNVITPQVYEMLVGNKKNIMMTPELLETVFGKKIHTPEVYGTLFGEQTTDNINDFYKYKIEEPLVHMENKMMMNPLLSRMLKNKKMNQFNMKNKMIQKIQAGKMIEEIQKEQLMKELIKDTEIPKMMETEKYQHIPLTYVKPSFGSILNQFEEKEIKNIY